MTQRGLHVFDKAMPLRRTLARMFRPVADPGSWDPAWGAVESGTVSDDVLSLAWSEVADAQLVPTLRDTKGWSLRLRTPSDTLVIRRGSGIETMRALLDALVGSRARLVGPDRLQGFRWNYLRLASICIGVMTFVLGCAFVAHPEVAGAFTGVLVTAIGLTVATLPLSLRWLRVWRSERRIRRETQVVGFG